MTKQNNINNSNNGIKLRQDNQSNSFDNDIKGTISDQIGTGRNARTNISYLVIKYTFFIAAFFSASFFVKACFRNSDCLTELKTVWEIFIPVITLVLGYLFGRGQE